MLYIKRKICFRPADEVSNTSPSGVAAGAAAVANVANDAVEIAYNEDGMKAAAAYIHYAFTTLGTTFEQINTMFDSYISGTAMKTPTFSDKVNKAWHGYVDDSLNDFIENYKDWSDVISLVDATGADYTEEAIATYTADGNFILKEGMGSEEMEKVLSDLGPLITYESRRKIVALTDPNIDYSKRGSQQHYTYAKGKLSEEELQALDVENDKQASLWYTQYKKYQDNPNEFSKFAAESMSKENPDVLAKLQQRYRDETGKTPKALIN